MTLTPSWTSTALLGLLASTALAAPDTTADDVLAQPVRITANGKAIDTDVGHAAPFVYDWNKDGKPDLLVGQFGGGKLKVYLNTGTAKAPVYSAPTWFDGTVPSG